MKHIRKIVLAGILPVLALFLAGCPIGTDYPPGYAGTEKIDKKLIGTWRVNKEITGDAEVLRVKFEKGSSANSLDVTVLEKGSMYSLTTNKLTGYCTKISGKTFVYMKPDNENKYYLYHYEFKKKTLITHDVSLLRGGTEAVKSTESYRDQISKSLKSDSCLTAELRWRK